MEFIHSTIPVFLQERPFLLAFLLSFLPALFYSQLLYTLYVYKTRSVLLVFFWGACVATIAALIGNMVGYIYFWLTTGSDEAAYEITATVVAPIVEESTKGVAMLVVFLFFRKQFTTILDGIVYGGITGLGFAATENVLYLCRAYADHDLTGDPLTDMVSLFFFRVIMGAWGHALYTAFTGMGVTLAALKRNILLKLLFPVLGWCVAVLLHSLHNSTLVIDVLFLFLGMLCVSGVLEPHVINELDALQQLTIIAGLLGAINCLSFSMLLWIVGAKCHDTTRWYPERTW